MSELAILFFSLPETKRSRIKRQFMARSGKKKSSFYRNLNENKFRPLEAELLRNLINT